MSTVASKNTFAWLVKREYWEYRGGFFWAPAITAMVILGFMLIGVLIAEATAHRAGVNIEGLHFDEISKHLSAGNLDTMHTGLDVGLLSLGFPIGIALFFVTFFYGLGALYNDRADRSVLFWKSLPISDTQSVLAKLVAIMVVAPVLAVAAIIALQLGFLLFLSLWLTIHGVNALPIWSPTHLLMLWTKMLLLIPLNSLWAMPSIGWLLLCSAYARSKPFLWAVMLPCIAGVVVSTGGLMNELSLSSGWFWKNIVGRVLFSLFPGSWMDSAFLRSLEHGGATPETLRNVMSFDTISTVAASPSFLIGIVAGIAMIVAAVHFRRQRIEAYA